MKHTKTMFDVTKEMMEAMDDEIIKKIITAAETSNTNSSLMVYTSGVNRTNIEVRTMNTQEALNTVRQEIDALHKKLRDEVRKVGSTLITADLSSYRHAPRIDAEIFTPEWDKQREAQDNYVKAVRKGDIPQAVQLTLMPLGTIGKYVEFSDELRDAIDEFEDYVEAEYAYKIQKLQRKEYGFYQMRKAERQLDRA